MGPANLKTYKKSTLHLWGTKAEIVTNHTGNLWLNQKLNS